MNSAYNVSCTYVCKGQLFMKGTCSGCLECSRYTYLNECQKRLNVFGYTPLIMSVPYEVRFEDTKWVIRSRKSKKNGQYKGRKKKVKKTITLHTLHRKLKLQQHKPPKKIGG